MHFAISMLIMFMCISQASAQMPLSRGSRPPMMMQFNRPPMMQFNQRMQSYAGRPSIALNNNRVQRNQPGYMGGSNGVPLAPSPPSPPQSAAPPASPPSPAPQRSVGAPLASAPSSGNPQSQLAPQTSPAGPPSQQAPPQSPSAPSQPLTQPGTGGQQQGRSNNSASNDVVIQNETSYYFKYFRQINGGQWEERKIAPNDYASWTVNEMKLNFDKRTYTLEPGTTYRVKIINGRITLVK